MLKMWTRNISDLPLRKTSKSMFRLSQIRKTVNAQSDKPNDLELVG